MEINFALAFVQANEYEGLLTRREKEAAGWARNFTTQADIIDSDDKTVMRIDESNKLL